MYYVYIIKSLSFENKIYTGRTSDLKKRLADHNAGATFHTAKYLPWQLVVYFGIEDFEKATKFEKYLKSGSGRAFIKKRFL
ncbi:MAG: GIY-YIG nuclease family protein [Candidatus Babeliaceae bacterium]